MAFWRTPPQGSLRGGFRNRRIDRQINHQSPRSSAVRLRLRTCRSRRRPRGPQMFGVPQQVAAAAGGRKRQAAQAAQAAQAGSAGAAPAVTDKVQQQINEALARLTLQLENERRSNARDENVVFVMGADSELAKTLAWAEGEYTKAGDAARKAAQDAKEQFRGNPNGKKPDALLASLLLRVTQALNHKKGGSFFEAL